uniref:Putative salivary lipocalin n=1 Tax=Ixodes ricinus TaxID=34613 RepID=A0A0K8RKV3_IXORI
MKTFIRVALAVLCVFTSCNAEEQCDCTPEGILETISDVLEYRGAWDFLTSSKTLYLMYIPMNLSIGSIQCVISTLEKKAPSFPNVHRWILYIDAFKGDEWQKKSVLLTMQNKTASRSSSSFTTKAFPRFGDKFPVVFVDSKCLIFRILSYNFGGRTGCAWWVKESDKDNRLWHCYLIFEFFCGVSHRQIYNKEACAHAKKKNKMPQ